MKLFLNFLHYEVGDSNVRLHELLKFINQNISYRPYNDSLAICLKSKQLHLDLNCLTSFRSILKLEVNKSLYNEIQSDEKP